MVEQLKSLWDWRWQLVKVRRCQQKKTRRNQLTIDCYDFEDSDLVQLYIRKKRVIWVKDYFLTDECKMFSDWLIACGVVPINWMSQDRNSSLFSTDKIIKTCIYIHSFYAMVDWQWKLEAHRLEQTKLSCQEIRTVYFKTRGLVL